MIAARNIEKMIIHIQQSYNSRIATADSEGRGHNAREVGLLDTLWLEGQEDLPQTKVMEKVLVRGTPASLEVQR